MVNLKGRGLKGLLALFIKVLHCWVQLNYVTGYYLSHPHANARGGSLNDPLLLLKNPLVSLSTDIISLYISCPRQSF